MRARLLILLHMRVHGQSASRHIIHRSTQRHFIDVSPPLPPSPPPGSLYSPAGNVAGAYSANVFPATKSSSTCSSADFANSDVRVTFTVAAQRAPNWVRGRPTARRASLDPACLYLVAETTSLPSPFPYFCFYFLAQVNMRADLGAQVKLGPGGGPRWFNTMEYKEYKGLGCEFYADGIELDS